MTSTILSIVPRGSGAERVHRTLAACMDGYCLREYSPRLEYFPPLLSGFRFRGRKLTHVPPDHAVFVAPRGVPLVVTFHNYVIDAAMRRYSSAAQRVHYATDLRWYTRAALRRAARVTAVSRATAELVRTDLGYAGAIDVIPNGVDTEVFRPPAAPVPAAGPLRILFSGNPTRRKGAQWLAAIAARLASEAEIAVTGGLRGGTAVAQRSGIRALASVAPAEMPDLYRRFDVLLLPSVREGMSLAVLEAMACGLAIVASDIPSSRELVDDGRGGLLCPVGDVQAFADSLDRLAGDPALRNAMGAHNRARVEREYTREQMVARYRRLFEEAAAD